MNDIFISYSKSDLAKAQLLVSALARENWDIWWDDKVPPGKTFDDVIEHALKSSKCVIVLWSKMSVTSKWVKAEASEGNRRGILIPAVIEVNVPIPLEFRYLKASQLTDWQGEREHAEYSSLRAAVAELVRDAGQTRSDYPGTSGAKGICELAGTVPIFAAPEETHLDYETRLMWAIADNGADLKWSQASQYAAQLRLGGYSDWRLPTIDELERLYDPTRGKKYNIRSPFRLSGWWVWSSTKESSDSAWLFNFNSNRRDIPQTGRSLSGLALCVRRFE